MALTTLEEEALVANTKKIEQALFKNGLCLLVKVLKERPYNREVSKVMMGRVWHPIKPLVF